MEENLRLHALDNRGISFLLVQERQEVRYLGTDMAKLVEHALILFLMRIDCRLAPPACLESRWEKGRAAERLLVNPRFPSRDGNLID